MKGFNKLSIFGLLMGLFLLFSSFVISSYPNSKEGAGMFKATTFASVSPIVKAIYAKATNAQYAVTLQSVNQVSTLNCSQCHATSPIMCGGNDYTINDPTSALTVFSYASPPLKDATIYPRRKWTWRQRTTHNYHYIRKSTGGQV